MNFDLNSLKEIDWNELELDNIGQWPFPVKVLCSVLVVLLMMILGYNLMVSSSIERYDQAVKKEQESKIRGYFIRLP